MQWSWKFSRGPFGKWYMAYLTTRPLQGHAILGRETAIQEVCWTKDDWLELASGSNGPEQATVIYTKEAVTQKIVRFCDGFSGPLEKSGTVRALCQRKVGFKQDQKGCIALRIPNRVLTIICWPCAKRPVL